MMLFIAIHSMHDDVGAGTGEAVWMLAACYSCRWFTPSPKKRWFYHRSDYDDFAWVFPLISSVLILNSFSFVADLSFQLFALFSYSLSLSLFSVCTETVCSEKNYSIGHFICIHKNSWKKWVHFWLYDGVLFILRVHYSREKKAWQWIRHVKRLNAPFPKNFNLLEWFSTVEYFRVFLFVSIFHLGYWDLW